jgi:hypothetical protein
VVVLVIIKKHVQIWCHYKNKRVLKWFEMQVDSIVVTGGVVKKNGGKGI